MRVCGRFPNSPTTVLGLEHFRVPNARVRELSKLPRARATTVLGLEHFRATADGGVYARQDHLRGMFPARRRASKLVGKRWQFSKLPGRYY